MFNIRPAESTDIPFILNSWLKRYRDAVHPRLVTDRVYFEAQHAVIRKILATEGLEILVACDPTDANHIYGYVVAEHLTPDWILLHWIYVKGAFRKFGLAKRLLTDVIGASNKIQYTHRTKLTDYLIKNGNCVFNPQYIWAIL